MSSARLVNKNGNKRKQALGSKCIKFVVTAEAAAFGNQANRI